MNLKKKYPGLQHNVIKSSDNGVFKPGDRILFTLRGDIMSSSGLYISAENAIEATKGWQIERDISTEMNFKSYLLKLESMYESESNPEHLYIPAKIPKNTQIELL